MDHMADSTSDVESTKGRVDKAVMSIRKFIRGRLDLGVEQTRLSSQDRVHKKEELITVPIR